MNFKSRLGWFGSVSLLLLAGSLQAAPVMKGPPARALTDPKSLSSPALEGAAPVPIADLFYVRSSLDAAWSRDSKSFVVSTNLTGRFNLWSVAADGGFPTQLTQSDDRQMGIATSPDGKWVVYESDRGGAEIFDLYAVPSNGGAVVNLTHSDDVSETGAVFSRDGSMIAFGHRLKTGASQQCGRHGLRHPHGARTHPRGPADDAVERGCVLAGRALRHRQSLECRENSRCHLACRGRDRSGNAGARHGRGGFEFGQRYSPDGRWLALTTGDRSGCIAGCDL